MNRHDEFVEELSTAECWRLLERADVGRLAVEGTDGSPDVFPVTYAVHAGHVYFRTALGAKHMDLTRAPAVAFEADGNDGVFRWSVVVRAVASAVRLLDDAPLSAILPAHPTEKAILVRLVPASISGRRFHDARVSVGAALRDDRTPPVDRKPVPIAHHPPLAGAAEEQADEQAEEPRGDLRP
ncbi:pyridoxamine 5'-phosphate oxidase family protein [Labedella populi]|uniref:pyridoxamine 5'-phosphate oxidase family protein n=1 Tax=Labedella populi TaxID=2498850 RepID=UPI001FB7C9AC|nr:pyridoxamine 5'-phosphate oxidase family protein [Labedella populi]